VNPPSSTPPASAARVWLALGAVYFIWGSTYLAIRFAVETMPPFLSAAGRFLISGGFLYGWRRLAGDPKPSPRQFRNAAIVGLFLLLGGNGGVVWAEQFIPSGLTALLVATVPLWMISLDALRRGGEPPTARALAGILIGFCGALLLLGWSAESASSEHFLGALAVLVASFFWAVGSIYGKTAALPPSPLLTAGIEMLAGSVGQIAAASLLGEFGRLSLREISLASALGLLYLTAVGPVAFAAYAWLLRNAPIPLVATYSYVNPLVAILLGYFLGKEILTARILFAASLIIGSVALVSAPPRRLKTVTAR
jgi:drug/metabolite transporter (DMT)-like permease